ncbi:MAG: hypothetical protein MJ025_02900 [Victivallaceae bacterium]|nr:hypothetical protein [Victivallaceae bacterium]
MKKKITLDNILAAADKRDGLFTALDIAVKLGDPSNATQDRVAYELSCNPEYLVDGNRIVRRSKFFTGRKFVIVPDNRELELGVLFPGHRFVPYVNPELMASCLALTERSTGRHVGTKTLVDTAGSLFRYHLLLGRSEVVEYFAADDPANVELRHGIGEKSQVTVRVYDMSAFYAKTKFMLGDALLCETTDYNGGEVVFERLKASKRSDIPDDIRRCDAAMDEIWLRYRDSIDIQEQLARLSFLRTEVEIGSACSYDEFIQISARYCLSDESDDGHAFISPINPGSVEPPEPGEEGTPIGTPEELLNITGGVNDPEEILNSTGPVYSWSEICAFMMEGLHDGIVFEEVFDRMMDGVEFQNDAQRVILCNHLMELSETLAESYHRASDKFWKERSSLIALVERRRKLVDDMAGRNMDPSEAAKLLADVSAMGQEVDELLDRLAPGGAGEDGAEKDARKLIARLRTALDELDCNIGGADGNKTT